MSRPSLLARSALALLLATVLSTVHAAVFSCTGGSVYVVAHPDDDLLFQSPTLLDDVASGDCITTVFLTSGDAGAGSSYAQSREGGSQAAYAQMFGVANTYTEFYATFGGQPVLVRTLVAKPQHQQVHFRLPDGGWNTGGYAVTQFQTLRGLYFGTISSITSQPGDATYTLSTLKQAIGQILAARQPNRVRTLDHLSDYGGGDHDDHLTTGRLTNDLVGTYASGASLNGYMGYPVENLAPTLSTSSTQFQSKCNAFFTYTPYDRDECQSLSACAGRGESYWLQRQYVVTPSLATSSSGGNAQTPATLPDGVNIAPLATATGSSSASGSSPGAAIDGVLSGYPANPSAEWSSNGGRVGTWFKLTWNASVSISAVVLYDRPNAADWLQAGTLAIDGGGSLSFTNPVNDGSPFVINLPGTFTTTTLLLTVTQVSSSTTNVGISELRVYGTAGTTPTSSTSSSAASSSTPASSSTSTSSAPSSTGTGSVSADLARNATASASSWSTATGQTPDKAIDGVIDGYQDDGPGDYTKEWATDHQTVGASLSLQWASAVTANRIVLYDRPNSNDWITAGTITFTDGSTISVPALNNAGTATTIDFATKTFSQLVFTVTSVSNTTVNVGLAEIEVFYVSGATASTSTSAAPTSTSAASTSTSAASNSTSASSSTTASSTASSASPSGTPSPSLATASASSWSASTGQTPNKAIDGVINGYKEDGTGDSTKEWASDHEGVGAFITLTWANPVTANRVVLYDRPNLNDQITSGYLRFPDQSTVTVPSLANAGTATTVNFAAKTFSSLTFVVTGVSSTTVNVGLAEFQVFFVSGTSATSVITLAASSTSAAASVAASATSASSTTTRSTITLSTSTASDTSSSTVAPTTPSSSAVSSTITSAASISTSAASTSTSAASTSSTASSAASSASPSGTPSPSFATASASSWSASTGQTPNKAIDGVINGYKEDGTGDSTKEWASDHEGVGAFITLTWANPVTANRVVLYDRPNLNDQITSGYLRFPDQSTVTVPSLANAGTATTVNFAAKTFSSLTFVVTGVSSTTVNVGLAEFQVFFVSGSAVQRVVAASAPSTSASESVDASTSSTTTRSTISFSTSTSSDTPSSTSTSSEASSSTAAPTTTSSSAISSTSSSTTSSAASSPSPPGLVNYARQLSAVTASSAGTATGQTADKAIDGVISGSPANSSAEWATNGQTAGAWLSLKWASAVTVNQVVLYDRPNTGDWITNATIGFSDGSLVSTGALVNDGAAIFVNFTARATTEVLFTIVSASSTTSDAGLAEIEVYNNPDAVIPSGSSNVAPPAGPLAAERPTTSASQSSTPASASTDSAPSASTTTRTETTPAATTGPGTRSTSADAPTSAEASTPANAPTSSDAPTAASSPELATGSAAAARERV